MRITSFLPDAAVASSVSRTKVESGRVSAVASSFSSRCVAPSASGSTTATSGVRAQMVVLSEGMGAGYRICSNCGWGKPHSGDRSTAHTNPLTGADCKGSFDLVALGRVLISDPAWPTKLREGRVDDILPFSREALKQLA